MYSNLIDKGGEIHHYLANLWMSSYNIYISTMEFQYQVTTILRIETGYIFYINNFPDSL